MQNVSSIERIDRLISHLWFPSLIGYAIRVKEELWLQFKTFFSLVIARSVGLMCIYGRSGFLSESPII